MLGNATTLGPELIAQFNQGKNQKLPEFEVKDRASTELAARREMKEFIHRAYRQRLMTSTEGTVSVRLDGSSFLITPYGIDRSYLDESDFVLIKNGRRERGLVPSRAVVLHLEIYAANPVINAVISAQSPAVTAFTVTGTPLESAIIPESYIELRDMPLIAFGRQFTDEKRLAAEISPRTPVVLLQNDAILTTGRNLTEAYDRLEVAEFSANAILNAAKLGSVQRIGPQELDAIKEKFKLG